MIGIEANPALANASRKRFASQIKSGRLTIVNAGIPETSGTAPFWINNGSSTWNSFEWKIAPRDGMPHHAIKIPTRRFRDMLDEYGLLYLKIDIEGDDHLCVRDLAGRSLPRFVSMESECTGDREDLSEKEFLQSLNLLHDAGYRRFKLIRQDHIAAEPFSDIARFAQRFLYAAAYGRLRAPGLAQLARHFSSEERWNRIYRHPEAGAIKPWGDNMPGKWLPFAEARAPYLRARERHLRRRNAPTFSLDWHATV